MIGDTIMVTVLSIESEMATLFVRYRDENQRVEQKLALEIDDRLEITDEVSVSVVAIRGDKIRLGVIAPATFTVHRREVYEALQRDTRAAPRSLPLKMRLGQTLHIGQTCHLTCLAIEGDGGQFHGKGCLIGGANDGEPFDRNDAFSIGSVIELGTLVRVCVASVANKEIDLKIDVPTHMICRVED